MQYQQLSDKWEGKAMQRSPFLNPNLKGCDPLRHKHIPLLDYISSPVSTKQIVHMLPWKLIIKIESASPSPVYLQIANCIIREIKSGVLKPDMKMPGTRTISELLKVHRKTVVNAYSELDAQGWIVSKPSQGTFVSDHLPEITPSKFDQSENRILKIDQTGYSIHAYPNIHLPSRTLRETNGFHDGPDVRLFPVEQLTRAYRSVLNRKTSLRNLSYVEVEGKPLLRKVLSEDLNLSRGMQTTPENIFITRGSQMGIFLITNVVIKKGDSIIIGETNYYYADRVFINAGAKLVRVPVDENGIDVDRIETICKRKKIRAIYVTSHHHYPTTVKLSAARRMKLLSLSEKYGFIIIEDDYDYDFHYHSNPILPLASGDRKGMVIYIGTLSKSFAPAIRIGYVAAPMNLIAELGRLRQVIDVQGDPIIEQAVAELFVQGEIRRHMKKSLKEYKLRRDFMCDFLEKKLGGEINFDIPEGGLAIWAKYNKKIPLPELAIKLKKKGVILSSGLIHNVDGKKLNATRMGFGWMNISEAEKALGILYQTIGKK
jgi:GntR family transcriptional regulator/MocR family aminotransferase